MRLQCPKCEANVHVAVAPEDGAKVKCPKCQVRFLPPDEEDEREADAAPRRATKGKKKGKKKAKSKFPVVPVALVSVGAVAIVVVAIVLMTGGEKKKKVEDTAPEAANPRVVSFPPAPGQGSPTAVRPTDMPAEVNALFALKDDPNLFAPPASVSANLTPPRTGANRLTVSLPSAKNAGPKGNLGKMTVDELKKASVYVKVLAGTSGGTGSGFLIHAGTNDGLIATNFHVIEHAVIGPTADRFAVSVVFDSGQGTEKEYPAQIVASEPVVDLAILRITGVSGLPKPIDPRQYVAPTETQEVRICGFPFGGQLATGNRSPAITINSKAAVSSIRKDMDGRVEQIQIDGAINPGNSGGPIVDGDGRLVGIAVATIKGTGIGFAVPAAELLAAFEGRVVFPDFYEPVIRNGEAVFHGVLPFSDPLKQIRSASLFAWSGPGAPPNAGSADAGWKPLPGAAEVKLNTAVKGLASADIRLPAQEGTRTVALQTALTTTSGEVIVSQPVLYQLRVVPQQTTSDLPISTFIQNAFRAQGYVVTVRAVMTGQPTSLWNNSVLALADESGRPLPPNLTFMVNNEFAAQLKDVTIPAGKGLPVRLAIRVGASRNDIGSAFRVIRADFMDGAKVTRTVPTVKDSGSAEQGPLAALNQSPRSFVGRDVTFEARVLMNLQGTPENPQYTFLLSNSKPAAALYFSSTKAFADKFKSVDLAYGAVDRVRVTVRVDEEKKVDNLPVAMIAKLEFLGRNGDVLKTIE